MTSKNRTFVLLLALIGTASPIAYSMMQPSPKLLQEGDRKRNLQDQLLPTHCAVGPTQTISDILGLRSLADIPYAPKNDKELKERGEHSYVLLANGKPIGYIAYLLSQTKSIARIGFLGIAPAQTRQKTRQYSSMLMRYTVEQLKSKGYKTVTFYSRDSIEFHNRQGSTYIDPKTHIGYTHTHFFEDEVTGFGSESDLLSLS